MSVRIAPFAALAIALAAAGCATPAATDAPGVSPSPSMSSGSPAAAPDVIAHPTGTDEIVLRFDEAGGFVPAEFFAAHVPYFTLYGDGTVVFVSTAAITEPAQNGPSTGQPIRTTRLGEPRIQELLAFALTDGGLAIARERYDNPQVADAPTAVFEIHAADDSKTVSVMALGMDARPDADSAVKAALARLGERLRDFDPGASLGSAPYIPPAYRGVLTEAGGVQGVNVRGWPWPSLTPADFRPPADPNVIQQRIRVLTPDEAAAIGVQGYQNGIQGGLWYRGPDDVPYSFVLRPLLPDETG